MRAPKSVTGREEKVLRYAWMVLIVGLCLGSPGWLQNASAAATDEIAAIEFAKIAVPRALDYDQGDRRSLTDAKDDFTLDSWREFMKWLDGYIDAQGAPTSSSRFTATGEPVVKNHESSTVRLSIPGTLRQQRKNAHGGLFTTTYRVMVDVEIGGNPLKIQYLKVRTCGAKPCDD